jgi:hypothetical protein
MVANSVAVLWCMDGSRIRNNGDFRRYIWPTKVWIALYYYHGVV